MCLDERRVSQMKLCVRSVAVICRATATIKNVSGAG